MDLSNLRLIPRSIATSSHALRMAAFCKVSGDADVSGFWRAVPTKALREIWFDGIGLSSELPLLLSGYIPAEARAKHVDRLLRQKTQGAERLTQFILASPETPKDQFEAVVRTCKLTPCARAAAAANPHYRSLRKAGKISALDFDPDSAEHVVFLHYSGDLGSRNVRDTIVRFLNDTKHEHAATELAAAKFLFQRPEFEADLAGRIAKAPLLFAAKEALFNSKAHQELVRVGHTPAFALFNQPGDEKGLLMSPAIGEEHVEKLFSALPGLVGDRKDVSDIPYLRATFLRHPHISRNIYESLVEVGNPYLMRPDYANCVFAADIIKDDAGRAEPARFLALSNAATPLQLQTSFRTCLASAHEVDWKLSVNLADNPNFPIGAFNENVAFFKGEVADKIKPVEMAALLPITVAAALKSKRFCDFLGSHINDPVAAAALVFAPSTSERRLAEIAAAHPELAPACAVHQNGYDLPSDGDERVETFRGGRPIASLAGGSNACEKTKAATLLEI